MTQKFNKSYYQEREIIRRIKKQEQYLNKIKKLNSIPYRNFQTLTYIDFLQKKITRIQNILT